jgi:acetyl-CoA acetyltransferase family protein
MKENKPIFCKEPRGTESVGVLRESGRKIVFLSATRTPFIQVGGAFKNLSPIELGVLAARGAIEQAGLVGQEGQIQESIFGNAMHSSIDSHYGARHVGLRSGLSYFSTGLTVNRICFSGGEAIIQGAKQLLLGEADLVLAGGYESTSQSPTLQFGSAFGYGYMEGPKTYALFKDGLNDTFTGTDMMDTAENLAKRYEITRQEADEFALSSQVKAAKAKDNGALAREITAVSLPSRKGSREVCEDDLPRPQTTLDTLGRLPAVKPRGVQTAGNSSGIVDGAAAVILATEDKARELGIEPIGELLSWATSGVDPYFMGIGPVPASRIALARAGLKTGDVDQFEINEAFAAQYLAVERELELERSKVNINGGAIALGHPLGATGARMVVALLTLGGVGLASACIGGGQGGAIIVKGFKN